MPASSNPATVQTLEKALRIVELLALRAEGCGLTEIGQSVGLHKSTVHRLLNYLAAQGYIEKDAARPLYKLGLKFIELASLRLNQIELKTEAGPALRQLAARLGLAAHVAILSGTDAVYIEKVEPQAHLRMYSQIGRRIPVYCSALGKCLVAERPDAELRAMAETLRYERFTPTTLLTARTFLDDVALTRTRGWALDDAEHEAGIRCVGAPIRDFTGTVIAAVSVAGAAVPADDQATAETVIAAADTISRRLGWLGRNTVIAPASLHRRE